MISDVVKVTNTGEGTEEALTAAQRSAAYGGLDLKKSLHLRLLAEETLGMLRQITGKREAEFWISSDGMKYVLHLVAVRIVTQKMRDELLKVSSSGKNEAAKGFMGKIRDVFDRAFASEGAGAMSDYYAMGMVDSFSVDHVSASASAAVWSMQKYKEAVKEQAAREKNADEKWDELERSIVANVADEVRIAIKGDKVEMTVEKDFSK